MRNRSRKAPSIKRSDKAVIQLWVRAGGRCEFHGCNEYLLKDKKTDSDVFLADIAHIVAKSKDGPRGHDALPLSKRNQVDNLMLACLKHHRIIDNKDLVKKYPKEKLLAYKAKHENRIQQLTDIRPDDLTKIIRLQGVIRKDNVLISKEQMQDTILDDTGRYQVGICDIDLTKVPETSVHYWLSNKDLIDAKIKSIFEPDIDGNAVKHISVFAMARIPFLIYLGYRIGDKIETEIYQKHREGNEGWKWSKKRGGVRFKTHLIQKGLKNQKAILLLSLSGRISSKSISAGFGREARIYEILPVNIEPNRNLLKCKKDLNNFTRQYQLLLRNLERLGISEVHLFPAIPVSAAVVCGRELLKDKSPKLKIYDLIQGEKYKFILAV